MKTRILLAGVALAAQAALGAITVKTVPWEPTKPTNPHPTWSGKTIRLKGTADPVVCANGQGCQYRWDFGDGSPLVTGTITNPYAIEASKAYTGNPGDIFTARLTVTKGADSGSREYYVQIHAKTLEIEADVAIDEGLWYLHKTMVRQTAASPPYGYWSGSGVGSSYDSNHAANVQSFFSKGHLETGSTDNPYTETVRLGLRNVFRNLNVFAKISARSCTAATEAGGNGYVASDYQGNSGYQNGMIIDAIVASGTPDAIADIGQAPSGGNPGILGRTYKEIVQDIVDWYSCCQQYGGWRYGCSDADNSACQWAAIGMLSAIRQWGVLIPSTLIPANNTWLTNTYNTYYRYFGYTGTTPVWGPYAVTPSGLVQLILGGKGRGDARWNGAEAFIREQWDRNDYGYGPLRTNNFYGLFSFTKAMLQHSPPIETLTASGAYPAFNWYSAQISAGDPTDGVARTLIDRQNSSGYWNCCQPSSALFSFSTAWAILMLNKTVIETGRPVAVAKVVPVNGVVGQTISFDGTGSFHQAAVRSIVSWEWEICKTKNVAFAACTTKEAKSGPIVTTSFPETGNYVARLVVMDDASPQASAETFATAVISIPPLPPTAKAGGPYSFCPQLRPWTLNGSMSFNPDDGQSEPGYPGDFIKLYQWDINGDNIYGGTGDVSGVKADAYPAMGAYAPGSYLIKLRVMDNTATSFPSSGLPDQTSIDTASVTINATCPCITNLAAYPQTGRVTLTWSATVASQYNVYRKLATDASYPAVPLGSITTTTYIDTTVTNGVAYNYIVKPVDPNPPNAEWCTSNQVSATPPTTRPR